MQAETHGAFVGQLRRGRGTPCAELRGEAVVDARVLADRDVLQRIEAGVDPRPRLRVDEMVVLGQVEFTADGAMVLFTYAGSQAAAEAVASETGARSERLDVADRTALARFVAKEGPFDVAIVNAGVYVGGDPLALDPAAVDTLINVNIRAPYVAAVETARAMPEGGRIVLVGSTNADRSPFRGDAAYSMSKAALKGRARGLARDLGARAITVNVVQPGPLDTDMNPAKGPRRDEMHSVMAIKRHATGAEVAAMVAYLAGSEAGMVTGAAHTIDGGFAA